MQTNLHWTFGQFTTLVIISLEESLEGRSKSSHGTKTFPCILHGFWFWSWLVLPSWPNTTVGNRVTCSTISWSIELCWVGLGGLIARVQERQVEGVLEHTLVERVTVNLFMLPFNSSLYWTMFFSLTISSWTFNKYVQIQPHILFGKGCKFWIVFLTILLLVWGHGDWKLDTHIVRWYAWLNFFRKN